MTVGDLQRVDTKLLVVNFTDDAKHSKIILKVNRVFCDYKRLLKFEHKRLFEMGAELKIKTNSCC